MRKRGLFDMPNDDFEKLVAEVGLEQILLGGRAFFDGGESGFNLVDKLADASYRIKAVEAMGDSHDINYYPVLRSAAQTDPDEAVRKAIRAASDKLEAEFGEDECLQVDKDYTGGVRKPGGSEEAHVVGDFFGGDLNDFR